MANLEQNKRLDKILREAELGVARTQKSLKTIAFSCTFYERPSGGGKQESTLYAKLTAGKESMIFSTGIRCPKNSYNTKTGIVTDRSDLTGLIIDFVHRAKQLYAHLKLTERAIDLEVIRAVLRGEHLIVDETPTVVGCIDQYINHEKQRYIAKEIVERTMWKNTRWANDFRAYVIYRYGNKAQLHQLKAADIKDFSIWLQTKRPAPLELLRNNTAKATAGHSKVILNYAYDNEWIERNPFLNFRRKLQRIERVTLTWEEVERFVSLDLESRSLTNVRDIFLFMCLTGLNYCDVEKLTASNIQQSTNGDKYINHRRRKTDKPSYIPLNAAALGVLNKYWPEDESKPLLVLQRNASLNRSIKQIAHMAGLDKSVTTKVARNTLASYLLNKGVPLTSIASILGHSSTLTTQKFYAKIDPQTVINDIRAMEEREGQDYNQTSK